MRVRWTTERVRAVAFVARCTGSAILAAVVAGAVGLGHPVWAVVSALVVSQDRAADPRRSFLWRVAATAIGLVVAVGVGTLLPGDGTVPALQLALAIAICAGITRRWPTLRVCMWTAVIVLMTTMPGTTITQTAVERGSEVLLGAAIAVVLHAEIGAILARRR